jgi:predicted Zn-dependent protease
LNPRQVSKECHLTASAAADLELMRASLLLDSDPAAAARHASRILADSPGHPEANLLLATASRRLGDAATAAGVLEPLARINPSSPVIQLELGRAYAAAGRNAEALGALQRAVDLDAALAEGWKELAAQRFLNGDTLAGDEAYLAYSRLMPEPPELADAHIALGAERFDAAEAVVRARLRRTPHDGRALRMLADLVVRRGDYAEAERRLTECLEVAPGDAAARQQLARVLIRLERVAEALPLLERLLAIEPRNSGYLCLMAQAMRLVDRNTEAIALMRGLVAEFPQDAQAWVILGHSLREVGEQNAAIEAFRNALKAQPGFGDAYGALANLKTFHFSPGDLDSMRLLLERANIPGSCRIQVEFALGKALEDAGEFAASFEHYARGAGLQRAVMPYDAEATTEYLRKSQATYTTDFFAQRASWGSARTDPIFIVGLPRSGSTLLEQILASHSAVEGTRELPDVPAIAMELFARPHPNMPEYPESVRSLSRSEIEDLAARYLKGTQTRRPLRLPRFVDKMLGNFSHAGLVHLMFPRASIIDARRHPLACGFSCYKQLFAQGMNFSYDQGELGRYYRDYAELMAHLDSILPGRVHRVHYERLVADPEREVRRLLDYCGLPFEAGCLRFYENPRAVQTLSSEQVRLPIYSAAVDQWRHYEPWLGPMKDAVGDWVERYPAQKKAPELWGLGGGQHHST